MKRRAFLAQTVPALALLTGFGRIRVPVKPKPPAPKPPPTPPPAPAPPPTPTPAPPPPTGTTYVDQRATRMTVLTSPGGASQNPVQTESPSGFWDGLLFTYNDITLVPDAKYGQVYRHVVHPSPPSQNPWWWNGTTLYAGLTKYVQVNPGDTQWYWLAVQLEQWSDGGNSDMWSTVFQFGYPSVSSPPMSISPEYGSWCMERHGGLNGAAEYEVAHLFPWQPTVGQWVEFLCGVKWTTDATGSWDISTRNQAQGETGFTQRYYKTGITTMQWDSDTPAGPQKNLDKQDLYVGDFAPITGAPTNIVRHTGFVRCSDKQTAQSYAV